MNNFPHPREDELVYSVLARARVHFLISSPKELIEQALFSRTSIATLDLPSHIKNLCNQFQFERISPEALIFNHTLFPLYAPFIPQERKIRCIEWMSGKSNGGAHLASGVAASRIPSRLGVRYCPVCMAEQLNEFGEPYWQRIHQVIGLSMCTKHNVRLEVADYCQSKIHRHEYFPASIFQLKSNYVSDFSSIEHRISKQIKELLLLGNVPSPTYSQWTTYYHDLVQTQQWTKGNYIDYPAIHEQVIDNWPATWLQSVNLLPTEQQSCWLRCILRKHRKSFSYLEHIVLLETLHTNPNWSIQNVIEEVTSINQNTAVQENICKVDETPQKVIRKYKKKWLRMVKSKGTKIARSIGSGGATYAWLYRHARSWLLKTNNHFKRPIVYENKRVNWKQRDRSLVKLLIKLRNSLETNIDQSRQSKKWFILQLPHAGSVENYLSKLPLTRAFLNKYQETISEYQIRRITRELANTESTFLPSWQLIRNAGLSEDRMTKTTTEFFLSMKLN